MGGGGVTARQYGIRKERWGENSSLSPLNHCNFPRKRTCLTATLYTVNVNLMAKSCPAAVYGNLFY